MIIDNIIVS